MERNNDIGLQAGLVVLRAYSHQWPAHFVKERALIARAIGDSVLAIEHIGSTSVPGLAAKPIIDIGIAVESFESAIALVDPMIAIGYEYLGENGIPRRHYFRKGDPRTHHIHMFEARSDAWRDHVAFRDYLRADSEVAAEYEHLKRELAFRHSNDRDAYTNAKAEFIQSVINKANA
jgi:GrpB-like predicted nucleotidyltransferase (UPF0157 family)